MQARAIFEAAIAMSNQGIQVLPEIMVPLVGTPQACLLFPAYFLADVKDTCTFNAVENHIYI